MASYVIGTIEITDPAPLDAYGRQVGPIVERFGGHIHTIGPVTVLEGDTSPTMAAVIEFESAVAAASWYDSPEYGAIRGLRQSSGRTSVLLVDALEADGGSEAGTAAEHPNAELARRGYAAFAGSDLDTLLDLLADDVQWHVGGDGPLSGTHRGKDAVTTLLMQVFELTGGTQELELLDLFADDNAIVALVHETATRARDGATLDVREAHLHRLDAGSKIVEFRDLPDDPVAHDRFFS